MSAPFIIIAGPCLVESEDLVFQVAERVESSCKELGFSAYLKGSYRKANRSALESFEGIGDHAALDILRAAGKRYGVPTLTDVHTAQEVAFAADYVDVLQIPAFLCRQTDLLKAAGASGKTVNIKKGQFLAPTDMQKAAAKVASTGNNKVWLTERGTTFGYNDLVVDMRGLAIMASSGYPVIYDATHSVQQPGGAVTTGGLPQYIAPLARAAVAFGVQGIFVETHPNPREAKSDAATQLPLSDFPDFLYQIRVVLDAYQTIITRG